MIDEHRCNDVSNKIDNALSSIEHAIIEKINYEIQGGYKSLSVFIYIKLYNLCLINQIMDKISFILSSEIPPIKSDYSWIAVLFYNNNVIRSEVPDMLH